MLLAPQDNVLAPIGRDRPHAQHATTPFTDHHPTLGWQVPAAQIAGAIHTVFGASAHTVADILINLGVPAPEVGAALRVALGL